MSTHKIVIRTVFKIGTQIGVSLGTFPDLPLMYQSKESYVSTRQKERYVNN